MILITLWVLVKILMVYAGSVLCDLPACSEEFSILAGFLEYSFPFLAL